MKSGVSKQVKTFLSGIICTCMILGIMPVFGTICSSAEPIQSDLSVTVDFSIYSGNSTTELLKDAYDYTKFIFNQDSAKKESLSFTTNVWYTVNNRNYNMLALSTPAVDTLSKEEDISEPYYIAYNVEGGTEFSLRSVRHTAYSEQAEADGLDWKFRFLASPDYKAWEPVEFDISTSDVNYSGSIPYGKEDIYTLTVPDNCEFIKICFPQTRNMGPVHSWTCGNDAYGTIAELTYTPADIPAEPLEKNIEPARQYEKTIDIADESMGNTATALQTVLGLMHTYSPDAFILGTKPAYYQLNPGDSWKRVFCLSDSAVKGKTDISPRYFISFEVEPGSSFRLQSLHRERESMRMSERGWSYRFKFYRSADGTNWTPVEPTYYNEEGFLTQKLEYRYFSSLDTYIVDIPISSCYIKIEFPQTKDYTQEFGTNELGNWQMASIKNFSYTEKTNEPQFETGDINCDEKIDVRDLIRFKKLIADSALEDRWDLNSDGRVDSLDLSILKKYILEE